MDVVLSCFDRRDFGQNESRRRRRDVQVAFSWQRSERSEREAAEKRSGRCQRCKDGFLLNNTIDGAMMGWMELRLLWKSSKREGGGLVKARLKHWHRARWSTQPNRAVASDAFQPQSFSFLVTTLVQTVEG